MQQTQPATSTSYTTITATSASETLTIGSASPPDDIVVTASSTGERYALDRNNGLELDYSGVTASSATTTFVWSSAGDAVSIYEGTTHLATLDATNTQYVHNAPCTSSNIHLDLFVIDDQLPRDPKIKIIVPTCT